MIGDGGGKTLPSTPDEMAAMVMLCGEFGREPFSGGVVDEGFISGDIVIDCQSYPGKTLRELGMVSRRGTLIAYGRYPDTYLPAQTDSVIKEVILTLVLALTHTQSVTLEVDPHRAIITQEAGDKRYLRIGENLADVEDKDEAVDNLGLKPTVDKAKNAVQRGGDTMTGELKIGTEAGDKRYLRIGENLADVEDKDEAVDNLGLKPTVDKAKNAVQRGGDTMTGELKIGTVNALRIFDDAFGLIFRRSEEYLHFIPTSEGRGENGDIGPLRPFAINLRTGAISVSHGVKIDGGLALGTNNALGGNSITLGDNDTGIKQNGDGILDVYANNQRVFRFQNGVAVAFKNVQAGDSKKFTLSSSNSSTKNVGFNLWGNPSRPVVAELGDDSGWHFYSQRNTDGSVTFAVNGQITPSNYGNFDARYQTKTGGVQDVRLGSAIGIGRGGNAPSGHLLSGVDGGESVDWANARPVQVLINGVWRNVANDGQEWHEAQEKFLPDTLKVIYVETGEVVWVGKDITSICPENKSVIELPDITANRRIEASGYWFYRNDEFVFDYKLKAEDERDALLKQVSIMTSEWEKDLLLGLISDEDREKLKAYRIYAKSLQAMDFSAINDKTSYNAIEWPVPPQNT
ncbi:caudovirales tail fiber assembly protein [Cooperia oncophora]